MFDGEEKANILEEIVSKTETLTNLIKRLIGDTKSITPVDLLQSTSYAEGSENVELSQVTKNTDDLSMETVKKPVRRKKPDTDSMDSEEFHKYLENHITEEHCYKTLITTTPDKLADNLEGIAKQLKDTNGRVYGSKLQINYILGSQLNIAKPRFDERKLVEGVTEKWGEWIKHNVGLSASYCSKLRHVADLLTKYPRLQNLKSISFTQLYNMRKQIKQLFTNKDIAKKWSEKMIYEDELCTMCCNKPFVPSFFAPCGHGVDYCESCMRTMMKDSVRTDEYELDGDIISESVRIRGGNCPQCRGKIDRIVNHDRFVKKKNPNINQGEQRVVYLRPGRQ